MRVRGCWGPLGGWSSYWGGGAVFLHLPAKKQFLFLFFFGTYCTTNIYTSPLIGLLTNVLGPRVVTGSLQYVTVHPKNHSRSFDFKTGVSFFFQDGLCYVSILVRAVAYIHFFKKPIGL